MNADKFFELRSLMRRFVDGETSLATAQRVEVLLGEVFGDKQPFADVSLALASYRPGGGEFLINEADAQQMVAALLNALGDT